MVTTAMAVVLLDLVRFKRAAGGRAPGARSDCRAATTTPIRRVARTGRLSRQGRPSIRRISTRPRIRKPTADQRSFPTSSPIPDSRVSPEFRSRSRFESRARIRRAIDRASRLRAREVDPPQWIARQVYLLSTLRRSRAGRRHRRANSDPLQNHSRHALTHYRPATNSPSSRHGEQIPTQQSGGQCQPTCRLATDCFIALPVSQSNHQPTGQLTGSSRSLTGPTSKSGS